MLMMIKIIMRMMMMEDDKECNDDE